METYTGTPVSPGIAIGPAFVLESEGARIPRKFIMPDEAPHEIARFEKALTRARGELESLQQQLAAQTADLENTNSLVDIFRAHVHMLDDPSLSERVINYIKNKHFTPEYAVCEVLRRYVAAFERVGDEYLAQRKADIYDIEHRLLNNLLGEKREDLAHLSEATVIVAPNLTPSQTVSLDRERILAFVTDGGGRTSHTAILARALSIPAVVGLGNITSQVSGGDRLIVDGSQGTVVISPDDATTTRYEARERELAVEVRKVTEEVLHQPSVTRDNTEIALEANIEFPDEVGQALAEGAAGIGLYRTEFLFHAGGGFPDEDRHFAAYMEAIAQLDQRRITIRFLDIGADKFPLTTGEENPFLGARSIRLLLRNPDLLRVQLRAVLRASAHGNIRCMFPLVSTVAELREAKIIVEEVKSDLRNNGLAFDPNIKLGIMIEVPSAALMADALAKECDFFSIGTNDLIQYTLAVDRNNAEVANLFTASDPSVLRLLETAVHAAQEHDIPVSLCGEMAGDPHYAILLVGLGLTNLSMAANAIPQIKQIIRALSSEHAKGVAAHALTLATAGDVDQYLDEKTREILPCHPSSGDTS